MKWRDLSFHQILTVAVGLLEWAVAIVSVVGTLALIGWILKMIVQKDKPRELD